MTPWRYTLLSALLRGKVRWDDPKATARTFSRFERRLGLVASVGFGVLGIIHGPPLAFLAVPFALVMLLLYFTTD